MHYRRVGRSGLQLSQLSFGSWVTYHNQVDGKAARELLGMAFDAVANASKPPAGNGAPSRPVAPTCAKCGAENPRGSRFCNQCAAPIGR